MEIEDSNYHLLDRVSITSSPEGFANADVAVLLGNNCDARSINPYLFMIIEPLAENGNAAFCHFRSLIFII